MAGHLTVSIIFSWCNLGFGKILNASSYCADCHKGSISHQNSLFDQEIYHSKFSDAASITLQNLKLFDLPWVHVKPIYRVSSPWQFSWDGSVWLKCCHPLSENLLWYFDVAFVQLSVSICLCSIADAHALPPWTSRLISPLWNFRNQCRTVRSQVDS